VTFAQKIVAITGAAGGIGQAMCRHFASLGATIAALDKSARVDELAAALRQDGVNCLALVADIGDAARVAAAFAEIATRLGAVDILINNAGASGRATLEQTTPETWRGDIAGNLGGAYHCAYAVLPTMKARRSGTIVTIGSVNALMALGDPAYSAAKAGLISLTKAVALEYGRFGIRANIILPGTVRTPIWEERIARNPEILKELQRWYPLGRIAEPIEVARAAAFLASDAAAAITGAVLPVDCGLSAGNIVMARELTVEEL
jgi:NAD(P)-dependent dehydrogenase (short-subunit alcohol dehydrogenase family)